MDAVHPETAQPEPLLVVVLGPTASGKTALSLALAERFSGEIVNCDSVAMYREFEIGTAKPNTAERARAPHHLLDFVDPGGFVTAGEYSRLARHVLAEISARHHLPIVVGGTGLYLRALLEDSFRVLSDPKNCGNACASRQPAGLQIISIEFCSASTESLRRKFTQTTRPS